MNVVGNLFISSSALFLTTSCADEQSLRDACRSLGSAEVLNQGVWEFAQVEIAEKLAASTNLPSGLKAIQTTNFTITPIANEENVEETSSLDKRSYLVTQTDNPNVKIARLHGLVQTSAIPTRAYDNLPTSCFGIKNWVKEL